MRSNLVQKDALPSPSRPRLGHLRGVNLIIRFNTGAIENDVQSNSRSKTKEKMK